MDSHLKVQPGELAEMAMSIRVFCPALFLALLRAESCSMSYSQSKPDNIDQIILEHLTTIPCKPKQYHREVDRNENVGGHGFSCKGLVKI